MGSVKNVMHFFNPFIVRCLIISIKKAPRSLRRLFYGVWYPEVKSLFSQNDDDAIGLAK